MPFGAACSPHASQAGPVTLADPTQG
jgi:hypothetical protein